MRRCANRTRCDHDDFDDAEGQPHAGGHATARAAAAILALGDLSLEAKAPIADAIGYVRNQWDALTRFRDDWRLRLDNNPAERHSAASRSGARTVSSRAANGR